MRDLRLAVVPWATTARLVTAFGGVPGGSASGAVFAQDELGERIAVAEFDVRPGEPVHGTAGLPADVRGSAVRVLDREQIAAELADGGIVHEQLFSGLAAACWLPDGRLVLEVGEPEVRRDHVLRNVTFEPQVLAAIAQGVQLAAKRAGTPRWADQVLEVIDEIRVSADPGVTYVVLELDDGQGRIRLAGGDGSIAGELGGVRCGEGAQLGTGAQRQAALPATAGLGARVSAKVVDAAAASPAGGSSAAQRAAARSTDGVAAHSISAAGSATAVRAAAVIAAVPSAADGSAAEPSGDGQAPGVLPFVIDELRAMAAELLKFEVEELDVHTGFDAFGFDSISLVALSKQVHERFGIQLSPAVFFDMSTFDALGRHLVAEFGEQVRAVHAESVAAGADAAGAGAAGDRAAGIDAAGSDVAGTNAAGPGAANAASTGAGGANAGGGLRADSGLPGGPDTERSAQNGATGGSPQGTGRSQPEQPGNRADEPIAIIGAAGRFPGARDLDEFWSNLLAGEDSVSEFPVERYDAAYARIVEQSDFPHHAGALADVDAFDAGFFGIYPREAELMDPQHRLTLETIWQALEDSAYTPADLPRSTGLFFGVSGTDYATLLNSCGVAPDAYTSTGNAHSILVNRVSYLLDIRGPSEPIDTACSSSLVAVHRAAEAIRAGSCEVAIAGGVNLLLSVDTFVSAHRAGMLSPDGRCKTFAEAADGYVRGEGVGAIILKPLARAEQDGDAILGMLRGTASNHGGRANSLTAPNADAQAELIGTALAGLDADTIGYVETHGTGTALGDPVEIRGLQAAFGRHGGGRGDTGLGSVKTNIGHLEAAAGIAGLLKVLLAMKHGVLPATRVGGELNPYIQLDGGPFHIVRDNEPWQQVRDGAGALVPRRAGVSSFGFGGANSHVVLEQYAGAVRDDRESTVVVPISARTDAELRDIARNLLAHLANSTATESLGALAWTLQNGREAMDERMGWVVSSRAELAERLEAFLAGDLDGGVRGRVARRKGGLAERVPDGDLARELRDAVARGDLGQVLARWAEGVVVDWRGLYGTEVPGRAHLPTYPFARERYWIPETDGGRPEGLRSAPESRAATAASLAISREFRGNTGEEMSNAMESPAGAVDTFADSSGATPAQGKTTPGPGKAPPRNRRSARPCSPPAGPSGRRVRIAPRRRIAS